MDDADVSPVNGTEFWFLSILSVPSVLCSTSILIYFYRQRAQLPSHQHLTLILIIVSLLQILTDFPFALMYYRYGEDIPLSRAFCSWWTWWNYSLSGSLVFTMAWGSVERHRVVFHNAHLATRQRHVMLHFLPMILSSAYPTIFYFAVIILNPCVKEWDFNAVSDMFALPYE